MTTTPLADGLRRRKAYRATSVVVGGVGIVLAIIGFVTGSVPAIVVGAILFVVLGFAFHIAGNSTLNTAIDRAAFGLLGRDVPADMPLALRGMHIEVFQRAMARHVRSGEDIDTAFRSEFATLTGGS